MGRLLSIIAIGAVLEGVNQGMAEAKTIDIGVICCAMSIGLETVNKDENLETVRAAKIWARG